MISHNRILLKICVLIAQDKYVAIWSLAPGTIIQQLVGSITCPVTGMTDAPCYATRALLLSHGLVV